MRHAPVLSPSVEVIERDGIALVFGMEWFPLLGEHPESQVGALVRRQGASHRVLACGGAASVGLLRHRLRRRGRAGALPVLRGGQPLIHCSAAACVASLYPRDTVAIMLPLPMGRCWLVAVHEGAVMTRTDELYADPSHAADTVRLLREAHPALVVREGPIATANMLDALFAVARPDNAAAVGQLQRCRGLRGAQGLVLLTMAIVLGGIVAGLWPGFRDEATKAPLPPADAAVAWRSAVAASAKDHGVQGVAGLQAVLDALHALPVDVAGWRLLEAECSARRRHWDCQARYRRGADGANDGFTAAALPAWRLAFDPMDGVMAAWSAPLVSLPLDAAGLRASRQNETRLFSVLQSMVPAFSEFRVDAPQALPVRPPLDADQRPVPRPVGIPSYQRRPLRLQAPLRSLSVLLPEAQHMSWDRIHLQFAPIDQPSLRSSSLRVSLSGALYEVDDTHTDLPDSRGDLRRARSPGGAHSRRRNRVRRHRADSGIGGRSRLRAADGS